MRKPNYKYWHKDYKKMYEVFRICIPCEKVQYVGQIDPEAWTYFKDIELLESTHMFDKHGKEIFERDILEDENAISQVIWKNSCLGTIFIDQEDKTFVGFDDLVETGQMQGFEIIGNGYENPELLDEQTNN